MNKYIKNNKITNFIIGQRSLIIKDMIPTIKGITVLPNIIIRNRQRRIANINLIVYILHYKDNDFSWKIQIIS